LIFGSFEILGKPGFCQFPGFLPGKTDHETNIAIFYQLKTLGKFYPIVFEFWARLEIINCCPSVMWVRYVRYQKAFIRTFGRLIVEQAGGVGGKEQT
jgi:hypothetical protein